MKSLFRPARRLGSQVRSVYRDTLGTVVAKAAGNWRQADVAIFHEFVPPPSGGGHQFMRALCREFERRGLRVETNSVSNTTRACLFNSYNFSFSRLRRLCKNGCRMVHRVDGPLGVYRGTNDGSDSRIFAVNQELADCTIFQSQYSLDKHLELGFEFRNPCVIPNAADADIFHARGRLPFDRRRKIRLLASSWSDNSNKGAGVYRWLEEHLDFSRFEFTFVGRSPVEFRQIRVLPPVASEQLAALLREHDIYLTASRLDPCSNSLIEALSCGLPTIYFGSGGHPELVGEAGFAFTEQSEIPSLLEKLVDNYETVQRRINVPTLAEVADRYLAVMGMGEERRVKK